MVYGETSSGAESDLEQATALARQMVGRWCMSDKIGPVSALPRPGDEGFVMAGSTGAPSQRTLELIDEEVRRIADDCLDRAAATLEEHHDQLDALADALLARETLDEAGAHAATGLPMHVHPSQPRSMAAAGSTASKE